MKIGILTFHNTNNFGAALQAYALQYYLVNDNHTVEFINFKIKEIEEYYALFYKPNTYISGFNKSLIHPFYRIFKAILEIPYKFNRKFKFNSFTADYLNIGIPYKKNNIIKYDLIICGSDQIWNPKHTQGFKKEYFGQIYSSHKKISYAASMGEYTLQENEQEIFSQLINHLDLISVRENEAKNLCEKYSNKKIEVVLDPVFLLSSEEWNKIINTTNIEKQKYILVYNLNKDKNIKQKAFELSNKYGYKIIELEVTNYFDKDEYKKIYSAGPIDFLGSIKEAEIVLTSSFHAAAFSIILKKEFYASNTTRIKSLLEQFNLEDRILFENQDPIRHNEEKIDYTKVYYILEKLVNHSKKFLKDAIK